MREGYQRCEETKIYFYIFYDFTLKINEYQIVLNYFLSFNDPVIK